MKKIITLIAILLFLHYAGYSQSTFARQIDVKNDDYGISLCQTRDGGYIIAGVTNALNNNEDIVLAKTDAFGDTLWTRIYGGDGQEDSYCVKETFDNGYILTGMTKNFGNTLEKGYIIKTNTLGDTIWTKVFENLFNHVIQTADSCYVFVGGGSPATMMKLDNSGSLLWTRNYSCSKFFMESIEISENQIVVAGLSSMQEVPFSTTIDLLMTDKNGDSLWFKQFGGVHIYDYLSIKQTFDQGFIIATTETELYGYPNIYLLKTDLSGNLLWTKTYGGEYTSDRAKSVVQTIDSGFVVTGKRTDFGLYLLKTDPLGSLVWEKGYNHDSIFTDGFCVQNTNDNHLIVVGEAMVMYPPAPKDILLIKTDSEGLITNLENQGNILKKESFVFPNPNNGNFSVFISGGDNLIKIYDLNGKMVFEKQLNVKTDQVYRIEGFQKGCFIISIKSANGLKSEKTVVN
jgi:hypothetical protein